jgi:hypothetical protein
VTQGNDDLLRKLIELSVASGKSLISEQTGFIQYHPKVLEGAPAQAAPTYENMLFCLALLRTKTHEAMQDAKILLDRLLYFQQMNPDFVSYGNFPVYLHDFPYCRDHYQAIKMLTPLFWIVKDFSAVLGEILLKRVEKAMEKLFAFSIQQVEVISLPQWAKLKIAACAIGLKLDQHEVLAKVLLQDAKEHYIQDVSSLGDMLSSLQMLPENLRNEWSDFWHFLDVSFQRTSKLYVGPALKQMQAKFLPETTLYDYYMAYFSQSLSEQIKSPQITALSACLIQHEPIRFKELNYPVIERNSHWHIYQENQFGFSLTRDEIGSNLPANHNGFYPFYFVSDKHTLVFDIPKGKVSDWASYDKQIELVCELTPEAFLDRTIACSFFVDNSEGIDILVNGTKATTFLFGDTVQLALPKTTLQFKYELTDGNAQFMGHVMRGNRPSQLYTKGSERYSAYDMQLFLRGIRSDGNCKIKITCSIV